MAKVTAGKKLKVFRTAVGFHDAYVAAPSQKAALEAWGSDSNLFSQGLEEQVASGPGVDEALSNPGVVIRTSRGSVKEQMAALGETATAEGRSGQPQRQPKRASASVGKTLREPKPSRGELSDAEEALDQLRGQQTKALDEIARRQKDLDRERSALERQQEREMIAAKQAVDKLRRTYDARLAAWRKST